MLLRLTDELRGRVLMQLDPWTLWTTCLTSSNTVPAHVVARYAAELQRLQPEMAPPPMLPWGTILQRLVLHVTGPILELDQVYMEFPGFVDDVFATVHILGRHREHNITTQQMLRDLQLADDSTPTMTEHSGRANLAIGISVLDRFTIMYQHEARAQAAAAILNLGSYRYEVFHGYWATDDVAFFHFQVCGIAGVIRLVVPSSDSSGTDDELLRVARAQPNTSDESNSE